MIKRLNKSKKNKQGAILVIVVLILALAMIFIASAMMLTQATRRRVFTDNVQPGKTYGYISFRSFPGST